ncbi:MAG: tetratricopeptide (TPR) repeat protein [Pseudohongiellaceae bacterium]|jgi:tetratricopeptide (TPR) repeat protein
MVILRMASFSLVCVLLCSSPLLGQEETADDLAFLQELARDFRGGGSWSAQRELSEYLDDYPASPGARELAGRAALRRGRLDQAEEHFDSAELELPWLRSRIWLGTGRGEKALELARSGTLAMRDAQRLSVEALESLGRHSEALRVAEAALDIGADGVVRIVTAEMDGHELKQVGWLLLFLRRYDLANQALVFADRELNGLKGPDYEVHDTEVLVLLGATFQATRQTGGGGPDRTLTLLRDVLDVDAGHAEALVVSARTYFYGNNGRAGREALAQALATNPNHPGALVFQGETDLLARQVAPALASADAALAINERHKGALALRAVALALSTRTAEAQAARSAFEAAHPQSAALESLLGRVLQSHYRFAESIEPLERALVIQPEVEEPLWVLAQSLANVGREGAARAALEDHLQRSPYPFPWRHNMLEVLAKLEQTDTLITESGFRLQLPPSESDVYGVLLSEQLDAARSDMAGRWGVNPESEVLVEVFDHHPDFSVRTVGFEGFGALGACFGNVITILSPLSQMRGNFLWSQTAVHEYAHVVTLNLSNQRMPRWLSEGVSVLEEKKLNAHWARPLERPVLMARANDMIFPVERMEQAFQDGSTVMLGYFLGSLVCEVIERDFGFDGLRDFVAAFAEDRSTGEAVVEALGITAQELDRRVLEYIDTEVAGRAAVRPVYNERGKDALRRRVQGGDKEALVELVQAYGDLGLWVDRDAALERALDSVGESPALLRLIAERDVQQGRKSVAIDRLRRWSESDDVDHDGLVLLASLLMEGSPDSKKQAEALDHLRNARILFPGDVGAGSANTLLFRYLRDDEEQRAEWLEVVTTMAQGMEAAMEPRLVLAEEAARQGDLPTQLRLLAEVVAIEPYDPQRRLELADLLLQSGDMLGARRQWQLILGMRPSQLPIVAEAGEQAAASQLDAARESARRHLDDPDVGGS